MRELSYPELENIAGRVMEQATEGYEHKLTEEMQRNFIFDMQEINSDCIFYLSVVVSESLSDSRYIARVKMNKRTGDVSSVEVFLDQDPRGILFRDLPKLE